MTPDLTQMFTRRARERGGSSRGGRLLAHKYTGAVSGAVGPVPMTPVARTVRARTVQPLGCGMRCVDLRAGPVPKRAFTTTPAFGVRTLASRRAGPLPAQGGPRGDAQGDAQGDGWAIPGHIDACRDLGSTRAIRCAVVCNAPRYSTGPAASNTRTGSRPVTRLRARPVTRLRSRQVTRLDARPVTGAEVGTRASQRPGSERRRP